MYQSVRRTVRGLKDRGFDFDLIDAHYFIRTALPQCVFAAEFERPSWSPAGDRLNLIPQLSGPRRKILQVDRKRPHDDRCRRTERLPDRNGCAR